MRPLEDVTLNDVGLTATFECEISMPGLKAEWSKANKVLKSDGRVSVIVDGNVHRLTINEATGEDEGQYTISFVDFKDVKSTAKLHVKGTFLSFMSVCILYLFFCDFGPGLLGMTFNCLH